MSKSTSVTSPEMRRHLRELVNGVINKDYAAANENLTAAVKEHVKLKVVDVLGRIQ